MKKARQTRTGRAYFKFNVFRSGGIGKKIKLTVSLLWVIPAFLVFTFPLLSSHALESRPLLETSPNPKEPNQQTHLPMPNRLLCSFQTVLAPFQEAQAEWTQSAENPTRYRLHSIRGHLLFSLSRSADLPWEIRIRHDAHRLRLLQRLHNSHPLPCEGHGSCRPLFQEERWEATAELNAVATLPGDSPTHWAGTLNAFAESWISVRSTLLDPFAFLRRSSSRIRQDEVNVSVACRRISE